MPEREDQGDEAERSKALLSDEAIPQVVIPKAAARTPRTFKMPEAIGAAPPRAVGVKAPKLRVPPALGKPLPKAEDAEGETDESTAQDEPDAETATADQPKVEVEESTASAKVRGEKPKRRAGESEAKYKERTLAWFKSGEDMESSDSLPPFSNESFDGAADTLWDKARWPAIVGGGVALIVLLAVILMN